MKKIVLLLMLALCSSCSDNKVEDLASFEFDGAWYWAIQYKKGSTKEEIIDYVNTWSNPNQTSFFFVFDDSADLSLFKTNKFNLESFKKTVLLNNPKYGFYKMMPDDTKLYEDGIYLISKATK